MEVSRIRTPDPDGRVIPFDLALRAERETVREFLAAKQRQFDDAENHFVACLHQLEIELASGQHTTEAACREVDQQAVQLAREAQHLEQLRAELETRHAEWQRIQEQTTHQQELFLETLHRERQALDEQFAALDRRRSEGESLELAANTQATAEAEAAFQRRYEMAMEDLRELKRENERLQEQLEAAQAPQRAPAPAVANANNGGSLSWEAQKQRILAALESEFNEDNEEDHRQRLQIEQVVQRTQRIIADKDAEIAELKQLLENQCASVGSLAVGAAALGDMLDKDAMIQQERENLVRLQEEWRAKLRKAEIEISVERAKLGRERSKIEEQLRTLEEHTVSNGGAGGSSPAEKPPRNRWLTRLGLKDQE